MAIYNSSYTGAEVDASVAKTQAITKTPQQINDLNQVVANPTLAGTEADLTGLQVGETKYAVPQGTPVVANPTLAGTEADLTGLQVGDTKYAVPQGGGSSDIYLHSVQIGYPASPPSSGMAYSIFLYILKSDTTAMNSISTLFDYLDTLVVGTSTTVYPIYSGWCFNLAATTDSSRPLEGTYYNKTNGTLVMYYKNDSGSTMNFSVTRTNPSSNIYVHDNVSKVL